MDETTLRQLLSGALTRNWQVLAGEAHLDRNLNNVIMLGDSGLGKLEPGDIVLVGASLPKQGPADFEQLLLLLRRSSAAALVWPNDTPPSELVMLSRRYDFPLLAGPAFCDLLPLFSYVTQSVASPVSGAAAYPYQVLSRLRHAFREHRIKGLLRETQHWLGGQIVSLMPHELQAYPPLPADYEPRLNLANWQKCGSVPGFPHASNYFAPQWDEHLASLPIMRDGYPAGSVMLIREERPFRPDELLLLDYAGMLAASLRFSYLKSQRVHIVLQELYDEKEVSPEEMQLLAPHGFVAVAKPCPVMSPDEARYDFLGYLIHTSFEQSINFTFVDDGSLVVYADAEQSEPFVKRLRELLQDNGLEAVYGVSAYYALDQVTLAFAEAKHAVGVGQFLSEDDNIFHFHEMGIYRLFHYPENSWSVNQLLNEMTENLYAFDLEKRSMLTSTLTCFVRHNFNYAKTAEELYAHPNTIRYRISILEQLWGYNLSRDNDRILFSVISKLLPLWMQNTHYNPEE